MNPKIPKDPRKTPFVEWTWAYNPPAFAVSEEALFKHASLASFTAGKMAAVEKVEMILTHKLPDSLHKKIGTEEVNVEAANIEWNRLVKSNDCAHEPDKSLETSMGAYWNQGVMLVFDALKAAFPTNPLLSPMQAQVSALWHGNGMFGLYKKGRDPIFIFPDESPED